MRLGETLSSDSLFHFTSQRQYLENIIENGFSPRYCVEDLSQFAEALSAEGHEKVEYAIPMVCFCDIPLSKVKEHISVYKGYGIGCTKAWGIERGITPVVYTKPNSETTKGIQKTVLSTKKITEVIPEDIPHFRAIREGLQRLIKFVKPYEGKFEHSGKVFENKRFYDEREWRFVPDIEGKEGAELLPWIDKTGIFYMANIAATVYPANPFKPEDILGSSVHHILHGNPHWRDLLDDERTVAVFKEIIGLMNEKMSQSPGFSLQVDPLTIKYIIVEQEEDVVPIADVLDRKFRDTYSATTLKRLMTRIITLEQIMDDF